MSVSLAGLDLANPIINGSGTFDAIAAHASFGDALCEVFPFAAYVSKTITLQPRAGNPPPRLFETAAGLINSIGLPNKGLRGYLEHDLPQLERICATARPAGARTAGVPLITNVMGATAMELEQLVAACDQQDAIAAVELNVSCPNVSTGLDIGADPEQLREVVAAVRPATRKPLIVKLTPNTADVPACAIAAQDGGADAVSLINTLRAAALAPARAARSGERWLGGGTGGLSGPAIRTVALAQVAAVAERVAIPVIGIGGVQRASHARDLLDAGASVVAVGTESFRDPATGSRIAAELMCVAETQM
ncbi:MAG TPA: HisA/HisF-related TIM barrel protein [Solirubrobacteraceae bacterium]|nr:HisA/HisF-related TIM barrel protein [Solirubrobacteraceae bacterium]